MTRNHQVKIIKQTAKMALDIITKTKDGGLAKDIENIGLDSKHLSHFISDIEAVKKINAKFANETIMKVSDVLELEAVSIEEKILRYNGNGDQKLQDLLDIQLFIVNEFVRILRTYDFNCISIESGDFTYAYESSFYKRRKGSN